MKKSLLVILFALSLILLVACQKEEPQSSSLEPETSSEIIDSSVDSSSSSSSEEESKDQITIVHLDDDVNAEVALNTEIAPDILKKADTRGKDILVVCLDLWDLNNELLLIGRRSFYNWQDLHDPEGSIQVKGKKYGAGFAGYEPIYAPLYGHGVILHDMYSEKGFAKLFEPNQHGTEPIIAHNDILYKEIERGTGTGSTNEKIVILEQTDTTCSYQVHYQDDAMGDLDSVYIDELSIVKDAEGYWKIDDWQFYVNAPDPG